MLSAPYIAQFSFSLAALIVRDHALTRLNICLNIHRQIALEYPGMVNRHRRFFYCSVKLPALYAFLYSFKYSSCSALTFLIQRGNAMTLFTFIVCVGILMLERRQHNFSDLSATFIKFTCRQFN